MDGLAKRVEDEIPSFVVEMSHNYWHEPFFENFTAALPVSLKWEIANDSKLHDLNLRV